MNGVHDMGGRHGMGPVVYEPNEPVFHEPWEGRVYALTRALRAWRKWNIDTDRHTLELMPPTEYLRMSYYERWLRRLELHVVRFGMVSEEEQRNGRPAAGAARQTPALTIAMARLANRGVPPSDDPGVRPLFQVGQPVRTRAMHPTGHTRLPWYARAKVGTIVRDHGVYAFPDTNADLRGEKRQHVYAVRFTARELWGPAASARDTIHLDLFDDYLERA